MKHNNCYYCGWFKEEIKSDGTIRNYCNDRDCTVDPNEPECNYED